MFRDSEFFSEEFSGNFHLKLTAAWENASTTMYITTMMIHCRSLKKYPSKKMFSPSTKAF